MGVLRIGLVILDLYLVLRMELQDTAADLETVSIFSGNSSNILIYSVQSESTFR